MVSNLNVKFKLFLGGHHQCRDQRKVQGAAGDEIAVADGSGIQLQVIFMHMVCRLKFYETHHNYHSSQRRLGKCYRVR